MRHIGHDSASEGGPGSRGCPCPSISSAACWLHGHSSSCLAITPAAHFWIRTSEPSMRTTKQASLRRQPAALRPCRLLHRNCTAAGHPSQIESDSDRKRWPGRCKAQAARPRPGSLTGHGARLDDPRIGHVQQLQRRPPRMWPERLVQPHLLRGLCTAEHARATSVPAVPSNPDAVPC